MLHLLHRYLTTLHSPKKGWSNGTHTITWSNETHARIIPINFVAQHNDGSDPFLNSTTRIGNSVEQETPSMVWAGVLLGLVITCTLILCYLTIPAIVVWLHRMITTKIASSASRIQRRYETIEGWLISKRVRAHCSTCDQLQVQFGCPHSDTAKVDKPPTKAPPAIKLATSYDTAETVLVASAMSAAGSSNDCAGSCCTNSSASSSKRGLECSVCMECFVEHDVVSWSPTSLGCNHVFHHTCIKQWLLYHEDCPYCRVTVLPVDREATDEVIVDAIVTATSQSSPDAAVGASADATTSTGPHNASSNNSSSANTTWMGLPRKQWTVAQLKLLAEQRTRRVLSTYFCLQEGLVILATPPHKDVAEHDGIATTAIAAMNTTKKTLSTMQRYVSTGVPQAKLAEMRESKHCFACEPCDEEIVVNVLSTRTSPTTILEGNATSHGSLQVNDGIVLENCQDAEGRVEAALNEARRAAAQNGSTTAATTTAAEAAVDVELCLTQLQVISNVLPNSR